MSMVPPPAVRFVNHAGPAALVVGGRVVDLERASSGALPSDPMAALARWDDVRDHLAGYTVGQDISDRAMQFAGKPPQFSMGKSVDSFGPIGPALVSLDAFEDSDDLPVRCEVAGELRQRDRPSGMIFSVTELVVYLSRCCTLEPGDLIFSGTPAGVGSVRTPRTYLEAGQEIVSSIDGIGSWRNRCVGEM